MSDSEFIKRVDDLLREELLHLGFDFGVVVRSLSENRSTDGCIVRMQGEYDDFEVVPNEAGRTAGLLSAQIARKLRVSLLGTAGHGLPLEE